MDQWVLTGMLDQRAAGMNRGINGAEWCTWALKSCLHFLLYSQPSNEWPCRKSCAACSVVLLRETVQLVRHSMLQFTCDIVTWTEDQEGRLQHVPRLRLSVARSLTSQLPTVEHVEDGHKKARVLSLLAGEFCPSLAHTSARS